MLKTRRDYSLGMSALALVAALQVACGGGSSTPPVVPDTTPPTVVITTGVSTPKASGDVTFTFTFSEAITTAFTAEDVTVAGAAAGLFTRVSATVSTLVVSPTPGTSGTITLSVPAGAFLDGAGNANAAPATASQDFGPQAMDLPVTFDSAWVEYGLSGFGGAENSTIAADPAGGANKVGKVIKSATALATAGTTLATQTLPGFANKVPFAANTTVLKLRVYSPDAAIPVRLKLEAQANVAVSVEAEVLTTQVNTWETLAFDFSTPVEGTSALDLSKSYDKATICFNYGKTGAQVGAAKTYYFDNLELSAPAFELVWSDEFDTPGALNSAKWRFETGPNWYNGELQSYTNRLSNARVEGGNLVIEALQESYEGRNYTSARVNSIPSWTYGRMEIKAKLPKGNALWPAIWMMPDASPYGGWPNSGEIDIMENWSWNQPAIYGTVHTQAYNHTISTQKGGNLTVSDPSANWHVYTLEWYEDQMRWFVDDQHYFSFYNEATHAKFPFDHPFHFIFNTAIEASAPGQEGSWTKRTMEIDYVRVYSGPATGPTPPTVALPGKIEAEDFSRMLGLGWETCSEGTKSVGWIDAGDWMEYKVSVATAGSYTIRYRVATTNSNANFDMQVDGTTAFNVAFPSTGGWQTWTTVEKPITLSAGDHTLRLVANVGFNLNWLEVAN